MEKEILFDLLNNLEVHDVRHINMEWYDGGYLKHFEYHQIKENKEDK